MATKKAVVKAVSDTVVVGCKLPNGLLAQVEKTKIVFNGLNSSKISGGHGLTTVPADFWNAWLEMNSGLAMVRNGFVFAHEKAADTKAEAKEKSGEKTGLESLDPEKKPSGLTDVDK